jgi:hypothetical protein
VVRGRCSGLTCGLLRAGREDNGKREKKLVKLRAGWERCSGQEGKDNTARDLLLERRHQGMRRWGSARVIKTLQVECRKALNSCSLLRSDPAGLLGKGRGLALARFGSGGVDGDPSCREDLWDGGGRNCCGQRGGGPGCARWESMEGVWNPRGSGWLQCSAVRCGAALCSLCALADSRRARRELGGRVRAAPCALSRCRFLSLRAQPLLSSTAKKDSRPPRPHRIPKELSDTRRSPTTSAESVPSRVPALNHI